MAGYIRQDTTNNIADGNVINASDFDNEYNAIEAAFHAATGHTHDGTSAEGAPITKIGPTQDVVASTTALTPKTDNTVDLGSSTLEYKDLYIDGTANIDSLVADTADINAGTIDGVTIGGASAGAGTFTTVAATTGNITTVNATTVDATNVEVTNIKAKDGTASMTLADATGVATFSANPILNAGTANGVLYLNGPKVATSGSALTFDGTTFNAPTLTTSATATFGANVYLGANALYYYAKTSGGSNIRMLGINAGNSAYVGPIDSGPVESIVNASSSSTNIQFYASGSEQMRLTSTGLGIGTSSPAYKLDVSASVANQAIARLNNSDTNDGNGLYIKAGGVNAGKYALYVEDGSGTALLNLLASGNLGIGTSSPAYRLHVNSGSSTTVAVESSGATSLYRGYSIVSGATEYASFKQRFDTGEVALVAGLASWGGFFTFSTNGSERMRLDSSGNLGIGTSSPGAKLDVRSAIGTSVDASQNINAIDTTAYALGNGGGVSFGYVFNSGGSVIARAAVIKGIKENATDGNYATALTFSTTANSASTTEKMRLDSSGNLGLGVTPSAWSGYKALQIAQGMSLWSANGAGAQYSSNVYYDGAARRYVYSGTAMEYQQSGGVHSWFTAPSGTAGNAISFTQAMTLDASGNLLLATTSTPAYGSKLRVQGGIETFATQFNVVSGTSTQFELVNRSASAGFDFYVNSGGTLAARITSGGALVVGDSASVGSEITLFKQTAGTGSPVTRTWNSSTSGNNEFIEFGTEGTYTTRGSITYNRAGGLVAYNTTSDYRAKDIIGPVQNVGATIDALKVYEGVMKGATQSRPMLIAHEAQAVAPYAVSGVKDEVNEDGTPKFQQMDVSSLVPLLLAEIQSLRARVAALEGV